jgi:hypothetical protein
LLTRGARPAVRSLVVALAAFLVAGCGDGGVNREPAVEAREGNEVRLGPISYRVVRSANSTAPSRLTGR